MLDAARIYLRYVSYSIRSQMQYKASFIMLTLGHLLVTGIEFVAIWALFARFGGLEGWTLAEVAVFYGLVNSAFALCDGTSRGFDHFGDLVKGGGFDRLLVRPRSTVLQLAGQELTLRRVGRLTQGLIVLFWGAANVGIVWSAPRIALTLGTLAGAFCFFYGLIVLQATAAFWTTESLEVFNSFTYGGVFSTQYPLAIYRRWFQRLLTFVIPLATINYFPVLAILGKADPLGSPAWIGWISPLVGPLCLALSLRVWQFGVRHYVSTGS
jgi:ABC-2 type transport system permease protein